MSDYKALAEAANESNSQGAAMNEQLPPIKIKIGQYSGKTLYSYDGMYWFYTIRSAVKAYWSLEGGATR